MTTLVPHDILEIIVSLLDMPSRFALSFVSKFYASFVSTVRIDPDRNLYINVDTTDSNINKVLIHAIYNGYTDLTKWIMTTMYNVPKHNSYENVLWYIYDDVLSNFNDINNFGDFLNQIVLNGHLEMVKFLCENGRPRQLQGNELTCGFAAYKGHLDVLKYLHDIGCYWNEHTCSTAIMGGGHLEVLKYLHESGCHWNSSVCRHAVLYGDLDILRYLHENGCPWDDHTFCAAAETDNIDILSYLRDNGCHWTVMTCSIAARHGRLDNLKWLHENGCPWDRWSCAEAADNGHLEVLKYLHENGCYWTAISCTHAAGKGHLEVLKYLHENGCPWDDYTYNNAIKYDQDDILDYILKNDYHIPDDLDHEIPYDPDYDRQAILKYLHEQDVTCYDKTCQYCN